MDILTTIRDADIGSSEPTPEKYEERKASRAVVFDREGKVALLHSTVKHYHKLPGGGVEENEDLETALRRELLEEIGCAVENIRELGSIEEYRNAVPLHQISYCFTADLMGEKGLPHLEEGEIAEGFVTEWMDLDEAIKTMENEADIDIYLAKFMQRRDVSFLKETEKRTLIIG